MKNPKKERLDIIILKKKMAKSRHQAKGIIMSGKVYVNSDLVDKPGSLISQEAEITIKDNKNPYVSRGGLKLEKALKEFKIDVNGCMCIDVGSSTGGFVDCLLKHGANKVFAVDVGYGQLAWELRKDPRVVIIERTNIRYMTEENITVPMDIATIDVSFISLRLVIPNLLKFIKDDGIIIALIKPQFEVGKGKVGKGGIVRDSSLHIQVVEDLKDFFIKQGLLCSSVIPSPILGMKGNKEFIIFLRIKK